jgi:hypothetical protein
VYYKEYLHQLELVNQEIGHFEYILENYEKIVFNPFSRKARWRRAIVRKLRKLEHEVGALNYQFHGDESFPNPVYLMDKIEDDNRF